MRAAAGVLWVVIVIVVSAAAALAQEQLPAPVRAGQKDPRHKVPVFGTAIALDRDGKERTKEEGSILLYHEVDGLINVGVHDGQWEAWTSAEAPVVARELELSGRSVALDRGLFQRVCGPFRPPFDGAIALHGHWIEDFVLHVVDATSGAELDHIEVLKEPPHVGYAQHPGIVRSDQVVAKDEKSPLHFSKFGIWFIRAQGHAWQRFIFQEAEKNDDRLELPAACALVIDAKGLDPKGAAKLRIEHGDGTVELLTLDQSHGPHVELDALPPGRFHVRAFLDFHRKPWYWHTVTLGESIVTLAPDAPAHAAFVVGPPPPGLHDDGTVDRGGIVTLLDGGARKPFTGDGSFTYDFVKVHDDRRDGPTGFADMLYDTAAGSGLSTCTAKIVGGRFTLRPPFGTHIRIMALTLGDSTIELDFHNRNFDTVPDPVEIAVPSEH